ncbi:hypothetical protein V8F33_000916 [Rhypophila sp. PSN 637]
MAAKGPGSVIDPTKAAKYPIILSDALLGKPSKETYTGVRYNHKPTLSSETAPNSARLKPSAKGGVFNLGFDDQGNKYQYSGTRTSEDGKYVLIFDPARKAFILHRVDSLFHMNLTKTPTEGLESLRKQFPHLEVSSTSDNAAASSSTKQTKAKAGEKAGAAGGKATAAKATAGKGKGAKAETPASKAKAQKGKAADKSQPVALTLPSATAAAAKPTTPPPAPAPAPAKKSRRDPDDSEEDESDDDIGLTIEYPDAPPSNTFNSALDFSPAFPTQRRFSEFVRTNEDEDQDGEADVDDDAEEEEFVDAFKLPSPVNRGHPSRPPVVEEQVPIEPPEQFTFHSDTDSDADGEAEVDVEMPDADGDAEADLEEALLMEFEGNGSDSSVSEEE